MKPTLASSTPVKALPTARLNERAATEQFFEICKRQNMYRCWNRSANREKAGSPVVGVGFGAVVVIDVP